MNWRAWVFRRVERDKRGYIIISKSRSSCYKDEFSITSFVSPYGTRTHFFLVGIKLGAGILTIISSAANIISSKNQFVDIIVLLLLFRVLQDSNLTFRLHVGRAANYTIKPYGGRCGNRTRPSAVTGQHPSR